LDHSKDKDGALGGISQRKIEIGSKGVKGRKNYRKGAKGTGLENRPVREEYETTRNISHD